MDLVEVVDYTEVAENVTDLFDYRLMDIIDKYKDEDYKLAVDLCDLVVASGFLASVVTFASNKGDLKLFNEYTSEEYTSPEHSVVCFGTWIIDPLNSLLIFTFKDYVGILNQSNEDLRLVKDKSYWWTADGIKTFMNLKKMLNYKGLN